LYLIPELLLTVSRPKTGRKIILIGTTQLHTQESGQDGESHTLILVKNITGILIIKCSGFRFSASRKYWAQFAEHSFATESEEKVLFCAQIPFYRFPIQELNASCSSVLINMRKPW